jgi:dienelactone hydrolase
MTAILSQHVLRNMRICSRLLAAFLVLLAAVTLERAQAIQVAIPTADVSSSPASLVANLFEPVTPGPHPAVVMLHGCGGADARDGVLNARHRLWGELPAANGYVALLLDSFSSRGSRNSAPRRLTSVR